jgi:hypothetical protein
MMRWKNPCTEWPELYNGFHVINFSGLAVHPEMHYHEGLGAKESDIEGRRFCSYGSWWVAIRRDKTPQYQTQPTALDSAHLVLLACMVVHLRESDRTRSVMKVGHQ